MNITQDTPADDRMPSWSPDGRDIAFFSDCAGDWGVYTVAAIGGGAHDISSPCPRWKTTRGGLWERPAVVEGQNQAPRLSA